MDFFGIPDMFCDASFILPQKLVKAQFTFLFLSKMLHIAAKVLRMLDK